MQRVVNITEKFTRAEPPIVTACPQNVSTKVLYDLADNAQYNSMSALGTEIAGRYVFNDTGTPVFYSLGQDCNPNSYHGKIQNQQQLDVSNCGDAVYVYNPGNQGNCCGTVLHRKDNFQHQNVNGIPAMRTS